MYNYVIEDKYLKELKQNLSEELRKIVNFYYTILPKDSVSNMIE